MFVDDHVTANLSGIETIVPDFQQTDDFVGDDMKDEDIQGVVADINQHLFEFPVVFIDPAAEVIGHQESQDSRDGKGEKLIEGGPPVHVGREILGEQEYHCSKEQGRPEPGVIVRCDVAVGRHVLSDDKADSEEEAAHDFAVAPLYDVYDL